MVYVVLFFILSVLSYVDMFPIPFHFVLANVFFEHIDVCVLFLLPYFIFQIWSWVSYISNLKLSLRSYTQPFCSHFMLRVGLFLNYIFILCGYIVYFTYSLTAWAFSCLFTTYSLFEVYYIHFVHIQEVY